MQQVAQTDVPGSNKLGRGLASSFNLRGTISLLTKYLIPPNPKMLFQKD
jgi:hypothetical protein